MAKRPEDEDERAEAAADDPDRAAILARRQRFIALALSGLATAGCEKPNDDATKPDPKTQEGHDDDPRACLKVEVTEPKTDVGKPMPCLDVAVDPEPGDDDAGMPQACLMVVAPDPDPEPSPEPCLRVKPPEPEPPDEPTPQPCLRVVAPEKPEPAKPQPCLKVAKPK